MALFRCGAGGKSFPARGQYITYSESAAGVAIGTIAANTPIGMNHSNSVNFFGNVEGFDSITIDGPVNVAQFVFLYGVANDTPTRLTFADATACDISAYDYVYIQSQTSLANVTMSITFA